jgi:hypothetical protein
VSLFFLQIVPDLLVIGYFFFSFLGWGETGTSATIEPILPALDGR